MGGSDETWFACIVPERFANERNQPREACVGHKGFAPETAVQFLLGEEAGALFEQQDQQVEGLRNQRDLAIATHQSPARRVEREVFESIRHGRTPCGRVT